VPVHDSITPHPTLKEWQNTTQILTTSESLGWNHANLFIERQTVNVDNVYIPYLEEDVIGVHLRGTGRVHMRLIDGTIFNQPIDAQSLQLIPRYSELVGRLKSEWTYGVLRLNRQFMGETAAAIQRGDPAKIELLPTFYFKDASLYHLTVELCNEARRANPFGLLYADSLINRLMLHLLRYYSTGRVVRQLSSSRLTSVQLQIIDEYIHAHLEHKISLADLAASLHISVPHFERMFRETTHQPPYRYVLEIRLERARVLLQRTRLTIAEIALQCGFSSQSHFTAHFTQYIGVSPARFARGVRE
jgi:AraC family transcriptional regulator